MRLERNSDEWFAALDGFFSSKEDTPFEWGTHDCCTFAADWVKLATGIDPMEDLRGLDSAIAAHRALSEAGGMLAAVDLRMGPHLTGPFAHAGDVAMTTSETGSKVMAVCVGAHLAVPGVVGLQLVPVQQAEATWRV